MVDAPLQVISDMVFTVLQNTISTLLVLVRHTGSLFESLGFVSSSGMLGFIIAIVILGLVLFFLTRFFLKSGKLIIVLFALGLVLLFLLFAGV